MASLKPNSVGLEEKTVKPLEELSEKTSCNFPGQRPVVPKRPSSRTATKSIGLNAVQNHASDTQVLTSPLSLEKITSREHDHPVSEKPCKDSGICQDEYLSTVTLEDSGVLKPTSTVEDLLDHSVSLQKDLSSEPCSIESVKKAAPNTPSLPLRRPPPKVSPPASSSLAVDEVSSTLKNSPILECETRELETSNKPMPAQPVNTELNLERELSGSTTDKQSIKPFLSSKEEAVDNAKLTSSDSSKDDNSADKSFSSTTQNSSAEPYANVPELEKKPFELQALQDAITEPVKQYKFVEKPDELKKLEADVVKPYSQLTEEKEGHAIEKIANQPKEETDLSKPDSLPSGLSGNLALKADEKHVEMPLRIPERPTKRPSGRKPPQPPSPSVIDNVVKDTPATLSVCERNEPIKEELPEKTQKTFDENPIAFADAPTCPLKKPSFETENQSFPPTVPKRPSTKPISSSEPTTSPRCLPSIAKKPPPSIPLRNKIEPKVQNTTSESSVSSAVENTEVSTTPKVPPSIPARPNKPKIASKPVIKIGGGAANKVSALRKSLSKDLGNMFLHGGVPPPAMASIITGVKEESDEEGLDGDEINEIALSKQREKEEEKGQTTQVRSQAKVKLGDARKGRTKGPKRKLPTSAPLDLEPKPESTLSKKQGLVVQVFEGWSICNSSGLVVSKATPITLDEQKIPPGINDTSEKTARPDVAPIQASENATEPKNDNNIECSELNEAKKTKPNSHSNFDNQENPTAELLKNPEAVEKPCVPDALNRSEKSDKSSVSNKPETSHSVLELDAVATKTESLPVEIQSGLQNTEELKSIEPIKNLGLVQDLEDVELLKEPAVKIPKDMEHTEVPIITKNNNSIEQKAFEKLEEVKTGKLHTDTVPNEISVGEHETNLPVTFANETVKAHVDNEGPAMSVSKEYINTNLPEISLEAEQQKKKSGNDSGINSHIQNDVTFDADLSADDSDGFVDATDGHDVVLPSIDDSAPSIKK